MTSTIKVDISQISKDVNMNNVGEENTILDVLSSTNQ